MPSAAALAALLDACADGVALTGRTGLIRWANAAFRAATGLAPDGSANIRDLPAADAGALVDAACRAGMLARTDLVLRGHDGRERVVELCAERCDESLHWLLADVTELRETQHEARRRAELLDTAQEFGRIGVWERDIASGRGHWDRHVFGFWGLDPERGTPSFADAMARIHPDDRGLIAESDFARRTGHFSERYRVIGDDGATRWIHSQWEVKPGPDGRPHHVVGIMMDDTEVYRLARSLDDMSAQLKLAVELGNIAIWRHDLTIDRMFYNDRAFAVLDIAPRPEGLALSEVRALIHPDDLPEVIESARRALQTDRPTDMEARYRRADGSWRYVLTRRVVQRGADGKPLAFVGVALDVTEQHLAEVALRSADQRAALAARGAGIGTWETDLAARTERWDEQMFRLRGLEPAAHPPTREQRLALVHPDDRGSNADANPGALSDERMASYEFRVLLPGGGLRWIASRSTAVRDEHGAVVGRVGVNWDISEARAAESARSEKAVAERESRAKSQFLARMSHELRTPLNAVLGFAQLLQVEADGGSAESRRAKLGHIRNAGAHLLELIDDVLDLSRLESGQMRLEFATVSLRTLVDEVLPLVQGLADAQQVQVQARSVHGLVSADRTRMLQVLINLLTNAIKYNRAHGIVEIEAVPSGAAVILTISDSGRGLSGAQLAHLFEPFNRLGVERERVEGSGIGLTIVKALVESMGGTVEASSEPGMGTVFRVTLPAEREGAMLAAAPAPAAALPPAPGARAGNGTILYVEDNEVNVTLVEELVRSFTDLAIVCEPDGTRGVARALALRPDLVLIDMQLPDFDGLEVLRRLRADTRTAAIPCIALSANAMPEDIARALGGGFADYWTKPIVFKDFVASLEALFPAGSTPARPS